RKRAGRMMPTVRAICFGITPEPIRTDSLRVQVTSKKFKAKSKGKAGSEFSLLTFSFELSPVMLKGERVILRGVRRDDLLRLWEFNNDPDVEIAGGGDPPIPQSLERLEAEYVENVKKSGRDGSTFAIEADGKMIG